jgi:LysM repeat protein
VSRTILAEANGIKARSSLKAGRTLMIPVAKNGTTVAAAPTMMDDLDAKEPARTYVRASRATVVAQGDKTKLTYVVRPGDTIGHIAEWYGVRATDIRTWNNLPYGRNIIAGRILNIWVEKSYAAELGKIDGMTDEQKRALAKRDRRESESVADASGSYLVKPGDTLEKIAADHGVTVTQIQRWNNLRSARILAGEKLVVYPVVKEVATPQEKSVAEARAKSEGKTKQIIYVVKKGDTIWQIAQDHAVRESQIREWNSLKRSNRIQAGQELIIHKDSH